MRTIATAITSVGIDGRPRPEANRSANALITEDSLAMFGQQRVHRPGRDEVTAQGCGVEQLPVWEADSLHTPLYHTTMKGTIRAP